MQSKLVGLLILIIVAFVIAFNVFNLIEAYGSGPPYYSRTTNMDKWQSPLPILLAVDVLVAAIIVLYLLTVKKMKKQK